MRAEASKEKSDMVAQGLKIAANSLALGNVPLVCDQCGNILAQSAKDGIDITRKTLEFMDVVSPAYLFVSSSMPSWKRDGVRFFFGQRVARETAWKTDKHNVNLLIL